MTTRRRLVLAAISAALLSGCTAQPAARATPPADPPVAQAEIQPAERPIPSAFAPTVPPREAPAAPAGVATPAAAEVPVPAAPPVNAAPATAPSVRQAEHASAPIVASATLSSPATQPSSTVTKDPAADKPPLLRQFDAELNRVIHDEPAAEPFAGVASDERHLLEAVIDSLTDFRRALRDESSLLATKSAPLLNLAERVRDEIPLTLPTLALCRSATQFGVYDAFEPARFTAGRETPVIIYCEVDHFRSSLAPADNRWETRLSYEAVLYRDGEHPIAVTNKKPTNIIDRCRNKRRDFFLADRLTIPADLPVGKYLLKVTVIDQSANHVAEKSVPLLIAPN